MKAQNFLEVLLDDQSKRLLTVSPTGTVWGCYRDKRLQAGGARQPGSVGRSLGHTSHLA